MQNTPDVIRKSLLRRNAFNASTKLAPWRQFLNGLPGLKQSLKALETPPFNMSFPSKVCRIGRVAKLQPAQFNSVRQHFHTACRTQQNVNESQNDRTTHFGFETVPESAKEAKGNLEFEILDCIY
jgi:hypothetical protein